MFITRLHDRLKGFTLIELLVVVGISVLMLGAGIGAYINFNERQTVYAAGQQIQLAIVAAEKKARVGDKECNNNVTEHLLGYIVTLNPANNILTVSASCTSSGPTVNTYQLPAPAMMQISAINMTFAALGGGVTTNSGTSATVTITSPHYTYTFSVDPGGAVNSGTLTRTG